MFVMIILRYKHKYFFEIMKYIANARSFTRHNKNLFQYLDVSQQVLSTNEVSRHLQKMKYMW